MFDRLKTLLRDQLGLPPWVVLVGIGLVSHILLNALLRKPLTSAWGLLAPLILGIIIEAYEIWIQYRDVGLFADENDPIWLIISRHGLDVMTILALPILLVMAGAYSSR